MAGDDDAFRTVRVGKSDQCRVDPVAVVDDVGFVGPTVTGQVRRDDMEAGLADRSELMSPGICEFGEAVEQQHERSVRRA